MLMPSVSPRSKAHVTLPRRAPLSVGDPLEDSLLTLWDTDGTTVLEVNDDYDSSLNSRIEWMAPTSGTYYLTVENADFISTGDYVLFIRAVGR